jgi:hypothetical protein
VGATYRDSAAPRTNDDAARRRAIDVAARSGDFQHAIALLILGARTADEPGWFRKELAIWKPSALDASMRAVLFADQATAPYGCVVLAAQGDRAGAEHHGRTAMHDDASRGVLRREVWLEVIAGLFERGALGPARELLDELDAHVLPGAPGADLAIALRDLAAVADAIDPELVVIFGRCLATPARGAAVIAADPLLVHRHGQSFAVVRARAPSLLASIGPVPALPSLPGVVRGAGALVAASALIALALTVLGGAVPARPRPTPRSAPTQSLCNHFGESDFSCVASHDVDRAIERARCKMAWRELYLLEAWRDDRDGVRGATRDVAAQRARVDAACLP